MPRPPAEKFQDLEIWQLGHQLTIDVYRATVQLPTNEEYGLKAQMRRAAGLFSLLLEKLTPKLDAAESTLWMRAAAERSKKTRG